MAWLVLLLALGLGVLWIIALATGGVAAWFLWVTFGIACALILVALMEVGTIPRARRPV